MKIDPQIQDLIVKPLLEGRLRASLDEFVIETTEGPTKLHAELGTNFRSGEFTLALHDPSGRPAESLFGPTGFRGRDDCRDATAILARTLPIRVCGLGYPSSWKSGSSIPVGGAAGNVSAQAIEVIGADEDLAADPEVRAFLGLKKEQSTDPGGDEYEHLVVFADTTLPFRNTDRETSEWHPFWNGSKNYKKLSLDGEVFGGRFSLLQDVEHLRVGFRHVAPSLADAERQIECLLEAIGYLLAIHPWPTYQCLRQNGKVLTSHVRVVSQHQGKMVPLRERHAAMDGDAPTRLIQAVASWLFSLPEKEREEIGNLLWGLRSADRVFTPTPIKLATLGAIIEALTDRLPNCERPPAFLRVKDEAIRWAEQQCAGYTEDAELAFATDLIRHLKNWSHEKARVSWVSSLEPLFPGRSDWLVEMHKIFQEYRNPAAHGSYRRIMSGDKRKLMNAMGRLSGFANLIIAARAGYHGPILESVNRAGAIRL